MFLVLCSNNWPNFNVWLLLLLEILSNMCIAIVFFLDWDVINFKIKLIFLIKSFFYITEKSRQKLNIFRTKKAFKMKWKLFFIIFKGLSFAKICLRHDSAPLINCGRPYLAERILYNLCGCFHIMFAQLGVTQRTMICWNSSGCRALLH